MPNPEKKNGKSFTVLAPMKVLRNALLSPTLGWLKGNKKKAS